MCDMQRVCGVGPGFDLITTTDVSESQRTLAGLQVSQHLECRRGCFFCRHCKGRHRLLRAHMYSVSIFFFYCCSACKISRIDEPILAEHRLRDANRVHKGGEGNDWLQVSKVEWATSLTDLSLFLALFCRFILLTTPAVVFPQTLPLQWALPLLWRLRRALPQQVQWWRPAAPQEGQVEHQSASLTPHAHSLHIPHLHWSVIQWPSEVFGHP